MTIQSDRDAENALIEISRVLDKYKCNNVDAIGLLLSLAAMLADESGIPQNAFLQSAQAAYGSMPENTVEVH